MRGSSRFDGEATYGTKKGEFQMQRRTFTKTLCCSLLAAFVSSSAFAQNPPLSPPAQAKVTFGSKTVTIDYSDGTSSTATLSLNDWAAGPGSGDVPVAFPRPSASLSCSTETVLKNGLPSYAPLTPSALPIAFPTTSASPLNRRRPECPMLRLSAGGSSGDVRSSSVSRILPSWPAAWGPWSAKSSPAPRRSIWRSHPRQHRSS